MKNLRTYIELDCLLDTRMGVIAATLPHFASSLASNKKYFQRTDDKFNRIDKLFPQKDFEDTYAQRSFDYIWGTSYMTSIVHILMAQARALKVENVPMPEDYKFDLIVNLFPYSIPSKQKKELQDGLIQKIGCDSVLLVSHLPEVITPKYLKETVDTFVLYDFDQWLNIHASAVKDCPLAEVEVIHPVIVKKKSEVPLKTVVMEIKNAFKGIIKLNPLPLDRFSFKP